MTLTFTEEQIRARHDARVAQLREKYGQMTAVPSALVMRLHELNRLDWTVFVAERDSKKISETIVPALIDIEAANRANNAHTGVISGSQSQNGAETPGESIKTKTSNSLDAAYAAFVGTSPAGPRPFFVRDNDTDREVASFVTQEEAQAWIDAHPNREKVERHAYVIVDATRNDSEPQS